MKKHLLIAFLTFSSMFSGISGEAQFIDDSFDNYTLDPIAPQAEHWDIWTGGTSSLVSDEQAFSGTQSLKVDVGATEHNLLLLGNQDTNIWVLSWQMYIPTNATGYYNIQEDEIPGVGWNMDVFFNQGGASPGVGTVVQNSAGFEYPEDTWFTVEHIIDLDNDTLILKINEIEIFNDFEYMGNLGSINFYSLSSTNTYFIDDVNLDHPIIPVIPCTYPTAQICDNLDYYTLGPIDVQADHWEPWAIGGPVSSVSDEQAFSNTQSLKVGPGGLEDNILLLNNESSGVWNISWQMYIPAGATGYYNIQEDEIPAIAWNMEVYFNQLGLDPGTGNVVENLAIFSYPEDIWFEVSQTIDLDNDMLTLWIDSVQIFNDYFYSGNIGSIDFFSVDALNTYYVDDIIYKEILPVGIQEFDRDEDLSVYPNPTDGHVNIKISDGSLSGSTIEVYNHLGQRLVQIIAPNEESEKLDLSIFRGGLYYLVLRGEDYTSTRKIILK